MPVDRLFERLALALTGRYNLVRELGRGGMATVYLGTDVKLGRRVAIKVLAPATRAYFGSDRFQREVLLAAQLSHPHIVPLFEADEAGEFLFYVMEYVEGESLEDRLGREGRLPIEEAVRIATEVGDALQYAHETGVIHRDVKPANILLSRGHAMVSDFGIAKLMEDGRTGAESLTGVGVAVGTPEYMSPEQARGERHLDARTDVYALAAVLYAMLAGAPPLTGPTVQAVFARVLSDVPPPIRQLRPEVPPHVQATLQRGLAKHADDRHSTAGEFIHALRTLPARRFRWHLRPRTWIAMGGLAVAVIVAWVLSPAPPTAPPGMVFVPAGVYPVGEAPWRPTSSVRLRPEFIDATEVTVAAYARYLTAAGGVAPWVTRPPDQWPVTGVLWSEAQAFCAWRTRGGRLPTEDEWEAAARGPRGWEYPWGVAWRAGGANANAQRDTFAAVGSDTLGRSWIGALDLSGNAWEWTATDGFDARGQRGHVIKGGAFDSPPENATTTFRAVLPDRRPWLGHTGFRCALDAT